jgi:hypothetical protein
MFEARLTWAGGSMCLSGGGIPDDLEALREHLYETARLMGAGDVAMQLVVMAADAPPVQSQRWVFRPREGGVRKRTSPGAARTDSAA